MPEPEAILNLMQFINAVKYIYNNDHFVDIFKLEYIFIYNNKVVITPISSYFKAIEFEGGNGVIVYNWKVPFEPD